MNKQKWITRLCLISMFTISAGTANAVPVYFTDRALFDAATGVGLNFESFENDFSTAASISFGGFTVSETNGVNILGQARNFPGLVDGAITDGTGALIYDDNGSSIGNFFSFTDSVTAFGLDIATSIGSTMTIGGSVSDSIVLGNNIASFWGVIDMGGITTLSFSASGGPNVGFDAVSYGLASVPEPSIVVLLGLGLVGIGFARRRNRS